MKFSKFEKFLIIAMGVLIIIGFLLLPFILKNDDKIVKSVIIVKDDVVSREYRIDNLEMIPGASDEREIKINFQTKGQYQIILDFVEKADGGLKDYVLVDAEYAEQKLIDEKVLSEVFALPEIAYTHNYVEHGDSLILTLCYSMPMEVGDGMSVEEQQRVMNAYTDFNLLITLKRV